MEYSDIIAGMDGQATEGAGGGSDNALPAEQELEGEKPQEPETATAWLDSPAAIGKVQHKFLFQRSNVWIILLAKSNIIWSTLRALVNHHYKNIS